jgi:hypothetical protein
LDSDLAAHPGRIACPIAHGGLAREERAFFRRNSNMNEETRTDSDDSRAKREADGRGIYHYFRNRVALQNRVDLGSARVPRAGERVPQSQTFVVRLIGPTIWSRRKDCLGATPKPGRRGDRHPRPRSLIPDTANRQASD